MKKKLVALTLSLVLALSLAACGGKEEKAETAQTESTTEVSDASEEETEEAESDAEEAEAEVVDEVPEEEAVEEELPTTTGEIKTYLRENGKIGDYLISDDNTLVVKTGETQTEHYPAAIIDGKAYRATVMWMSNAQELFYSKLRQEAEARNEDPEDVDWGYVAETIYDMPVYVRVELTDDPDIIKISYIISDEDMKWFNETVRPITDQKETIWYKSTDGIFNDWIKIQGYYDSDSKYIYVTLNDFKDNKLTLTVSLRDMGLNIDEKHKTPEILTYKLNKPIEYDPYVRQDELDEDIKYTLVAD